MPSIGHRQPLRHRRRLAAGCGLLATLFVAAGSCFEEPVTELLLLRFPAGGGVAVEQTLTLDSALVDRDPTRRLAELESAVLQGRDPWAARFASLGAESDGFEWLRREGRLVSARRTARLVDPARLATLFADTSVTADYQRGDGWAQLALYPGAATRASRQEARQVAEALDLWSEAIARYLADAEAVYRHLERQPERARPLVTHLFAAELEVEPPPVEPEEEELVRSLQESLEQVVGVLWVDGGHAASLDTMSRRVYDPFPAELHVEIPGAPLEVEGFWQRQNGKTTRLAVPGLGFWQALEALEGEWIFPDPALAWAHLVESEGENRAGIEELVTAERRTLPAPSPAEVRQALEDLLKPEPAYRIVWRTVAEAPP